MKIVSLNVGLPRRVLDHDREVTTSIFKSPVPGPAVLRRLNLDGDRQSDLNVHGGKNKAVYAYASEHYDYWHDQLPEADLTWGNFGENLTTEGLREQDASIGDVYRMGGALVKVTQPRMPCYKLGIRFGRDDMVKRFLASGRSGIYFSVVEEGLVYFGGQPRVCLFSRQRGSRSSHCERANSSAWPAPGLRRRARADRSVSASPKSMAISCRSSESYSASSRL
jgi:MOSC domain-containing protein YiiM